MRRCRIFWFRVSGIQTELLLDGREIGGMVGRGTPYAVLETWNLSEAAFSCPNPKKTCVFHVPFWSEKSMSTGYQNDPKWSWVEKEVKRIILRLPPSALYHALKYQILGLVIGMTNCNGGQTPQRLQAFVALDTDGSGEIDYSEFLAPWRRRHPLGFFRKPAECLPIATKSISRHCCYNTRTNLLDESGRYLDDGYLLLTNMKQKLDLSPSQTTFSRRCLWISTRASMAWLQNMASFSPPTGR